MMLILRLLGDFFMAAGMITLFGMFVVIVFFDGHVENVSGLYLFLPSIIFAWLMGVFWRWPNETREEFKKHNETNQ